MKRYSFTFVTILLLFFSLFPAGPVRADVAPPKSPPGSDLAPGTEVTQVRMVSETVILNISQDPADREGAVADTIATFTMRNLGTDHERMQARFPLSFFNGNSDGFGNFPEIPQITVKINGKPANTQRVMQPALTSGGDSYQERQEVPWAVFDVTFPPAEDVTIEVRYQANGYGYYPYEVFRYVLETGAGWKDTIGSADIIAHFPYEASKYDVWLTDDTTGYSETTPGAMLNGKEVRWHFENLEPTAENNIQITVVTPALWQAVLQEMGNVSKNPNDGEAWGRLGKAYKEVARLSKGYLREDTAGLEIYGLSKQAYEKCLALLPSDLLWHYGYADLLWSHYFFDLYTRGLPDPAGVLPRVLSELKTSLELDSDNQQAKDLLSWISSNIPGSVTINGDNYDYLALTATPLPPTPFGEATETPVPIPTETIMALPTTPPTPTIVPAPIPTEKPSATPFCGGTALILPALFGVLFLSKRILR